MGSSCRRLIVVPGISTCSINAPSYLAVFHGEEKIGIPKSLQGPPVREGVCPHFWVALEWSRQ